MSEMSYINNSHFYVKFFLLDDSISLNDWGVTRDALTKNMASFVGKPFIIMPTFGHPNPASGDDMFKAQEPYRVGTIIETGIDTKTDKAWAVAEIKDEKAIKMIKAGDIKFVSPSIVFHAFDLTHDTNGKEIINNFTAAHVAGVKDPAFGMNKAMIKGQCSGDEHTCMSHLKSVQAAVEKTVSPCGFETTYRMSDKSDCLQKCFHEKKKSGLDVTDPQNIAICTSECHTQKKQADYAIIEEDDGLMVKDADYATIKRGKVKLEIGSPQDKLLHTKDLPHSHVHINPDGTKTIKRYGTGSTTSANKDDICKICGKTKGMHDDESDHEFDKGMGESYNAVVELTDFTHKLNTWMDETYPSKSVLVGNLVRFTKKVSRLLDQI